MIFSLPPSLTSNMVNPHPDYQELRANITRISHKYITYIKISKNYNLKKVLNLE